MSYPGSTSTPELSQLNQDFNLQVEHTRNVLVVPFSYLLLRFNVRIVTFSSLLVRSCLRHHRAHTINLPQVLGHLKQGRGDERRLFPLFIRGLSSTRACHNLSRTCHNLTRTDLSPLGLWARVQRIRVFDESGRAAMRVLPELFPSELPGNRPYPLETNPLPLLYVPGLLLPRDCHNLTRIFHPR